MNDPSSRFYSNRPVNGDSRRVSSAGRMTTLSALLLTAAVIFSIATVKRALGTDKGTSPLADAAFAAVTALDDAEGGNTAEITGTAGASETAETTETVDAVNAVDTADTVGVVASGEIVETAATAIIA